MVRDPRLSGLRRTLVTRRNGWVLAAVLAILGILLGAQQLSRATDLAGQALGDAMRLVLDAGWLLLLLAAAGLAAGLALSGPRGRATAQRLRWLRGRLTTRPVLVGTATAGLLLMLVLVVVVVPPRFTANRQFKTASEELKAQNDVRTTLLQGLGALLVLTGAAIGASVAYRGVRETRRQIAQTAADNEEQFTLTRQGQITDRYTKAVDQLGSEHQDVRLGGIYALERMARDSPPDRATIEEVLTAFVRGHAPWPPPPALPSLQTMTQQLANFGYRQRSAVRRWLTKESAEPAQEGRPDKGMEPEGPAADVRAAVIVLGRRQLPPDGLRRLDLAGVDLREVQLSRANLQGAWLKGANLQGTVLLGANLQDAILTGANLQGAKLALAYLRRAWLNDANLQGADLGGASLEGARLNRANLQAVGLLDTWLRGAEFAGANLQGTELHAARLSGALANEQTRWPDGWDRAKAEAQGVQYLD